MLTCLLWQVSRSPGSLHFVEARPSEKAKARAQARTFLSETLVALSPPTSHRQEVQSAQAALVGEEQLLLEGEEQLQLEERELVKPGVASLRLAAIHERV